MPCGSYNYVIFWYIYKVLIFFTFSITFGLLNLGPGGEIVTWAGVVAFTLSLIGGLSLSAGPFWGILKFVKL